VECDADGDEAGVEGGDGEAEPVLILVVGAQVESGREIKVGPAAEGIEVVGDVGDVAGEVVVAAAV
jgi:hypothetical protein